LAENWFKKRGQESINTVDRKYLGVREAMRSDRTRRGQGN
jgi:hypothetical protein